MYLIARFRAAVSFLTYRNTQKPDTNRQDVI